MRGEINENGQPIIKHFCIRTKSSTGEVFISNKIGKFGKFGNVSDLIEYYCQNKGRLMISCTINRGEDGVGIFYPSELHSKY